MIKLFTLKQQKKDGEGAKSGSKRASAAQLRITKGAAWLDFRVCVLNIISHCDCECQLLPVYF